MNPENPFIVCTSVEGFDPIIDAKHWEGKNRSVARDIFCVSCKTQVVMSQNMFETMYKGKDPVPSVLCGRCFIKTYNGEEDTVAIPNFLLKK